MGLLPPDGPRSIRPATPDDVPAIRTIYNHYVVHSTATFLLEPESDEDRLGWLSWRGPEHPAIVATVGETVVGFGALSPFHVRPAYRFTTEICFYLDPHEIGKGTGRALLEELIELAKQAGHHSIIACTCAESTASLALQERNGFETIGTFPEVGYKFGRWLDVIYKQLRLQPFQSSP